MKIQKIQLILSRKIPLITRIDGQNYFFLQRYANQTGKNVSRIANDAFELFRKFTTWKDMHTAADAQSEEDVAEAMADFDDYLNIIEREENTTNISQQSAPE